jgi:hypothetical protein
MGFPGWIVGHWFELLQTASIAVGFYVTVHSIRADTNVRKVQNLFTLTAAHRDIWSKLYDHPDLERILSESLDLAANPPSVAEELFVHLLILHLRTSFKARQAGMEFDGDAVSADIREFLSLPIPREMWKKSKQFQDRDFVDFVESSLANNP